MRKNIHYVLWVLLTILLCECAGNEIKTQLNGIELLLKEKQNEKALQLLNRMNPEAIEDDECLALYWLFKMQADCRLNNKVSSIEPLKHTEKYFINLHNYDRLAWTYYYMGFFSNRMGDRADAIRYLKKGENAALKVRDYAVLHHINQVISAINHDAKEFELAIEYGKKSVNYAFKVNDSVILATDLMNLAATYSIINKMDSANYYIKRMLPYLEAVPVDQRSDHYCNIGFLYYDFGNNVLAEKFLLKSVDIEYNPYSYRGLAQIYKKEGNKEKAFEMWHKALNTTSLSLKANVVKDMAKAKKEEGDYKAAHELSLWSAALKDSLHRQQKEENIKGQQELFDKERANEQLREERGHAIWMVAILTLLIAALAAWTIYKKRKNSRRMNALNEELEQKDSAIEQLQQENEQKGKELERLSRDMTGYEEKHEKLLAAGQRLYEEIVGGGNTLKWEKEDFVHFVRYYKLKHADFVRHLENDFDELTARQKVFMILYDMGMTDEEVMRTLVLSETSIRVNKTRIKGKKLSSDKSEEETVN